MPEQAVRIASLRLMPEHDHGLVLHVDPGVIVVLLILRGDAIAGEHQRGVDLRRAAERQRREIGPQLERDFLRFFCLRVGRADKLESIAIRRAKLRPDRNVELSGTACRRRGPS